MATQRKLPPQVTSRARKAAQYIKPFTTQEERDKAVDEKATLLSIPVEDREFVVRMMLQEWWDNDKSLTDMRRHGSAQSVYNKAVKYTREGAPSNQINITISDTVGLYNMYLDRVSG